jgi:putative oxidoreductase
MFTEKCKFSPDWGLLALRIGLAIPLIVHGWAKLQNIDLFTGVLADIGVPAAVLFAWLVTLLEFVGGLMILLGMWTRYVLLLVVAEFLFTLFVVKGWAIGAEADIDLAIVAMALALFCLGNGKYSLQAMWGRRTVMTTM